MGNTTWKELERRFGRVWAEMLGHPEPFRRNDARTNAGDSELNSDVDIVHPKVSVGELEGITGECRHIKGRELGYIAGTLRDLTKSLKGIQAIPLVLMNGRYLCHWLRHGLTAWQFFVHPSFKPGEQCTGLLPVHTLCKFSITHLQVAHSATLLKEKFEQASRYAKNKKLYPAVCLGFHAIQPVEVFDISWTL